MAEEFEVRGVHEDLLDEAGEREPRGMAGQLAVMTAVLATFGAMFSYMAGATQADAGLFKNDAAIKKTEASDQWNFYQAKSGKQNLSELGMRLSVGGARIMLDPAIQGTHLKEWTLYSMVRTDLVVRGIPWVGLLLKHRGAIPPSGLNLGWRHRFSALACLALVAAAILGNLWIALVALVLLIALNLEFYRFLARRERIPRAIVGVGLHIVHQLVAVAAVPLGVLAHLTRRRNAAPVTTAN